MNVFIIAAQTADGFIARNTEHLSTKWTSREDATWFNDRTKRAGVMVMGSTTFATINRPLPGRVTIVYTRQPAKLMSSHNAVEITENQLLEHLDPATIYVTKLSPPQLIKQLETQQFSELAVCGGAAIYTLFLKAGVVNSIYLTVEPVLFGTGISLFSETVEHNNLRLKSSSKMNENTLLVEYSLV